MSRGIQEGYIVDYDIIFPLIKMVPSTETEGKTYVVDVDIPLSFPKDDMTAKSLFLATGMLEKGSRRCIVYLQKCDECDLFMARFRDVCEQYHGIRVWCGKMDHTTTANSRKILLEQFQEKSTNYDFFIMATVRVLDEAVDIPKCDSEFVTNVGNTTSDIRTIQRLQRGARLDADNPMKKNHLFLWTENWGRAVNALSMVKEMDPNYHKKIKILSGSYDTMGKTETNVELKLMNSKLTQYISIRCETSDERWLRMFEELKKYYSENCHLPSYHTCEDKYKVIANWVTSQKRRILRNDIPSYQRENLLGFKEINEWFIKIQTVGKTEKLVWNECFPLLKDYIDTNNKIPVITYKTDDGFKLGIWTFAQKMAIKKHRLTDIQLNKLLELKPIKEWHKSYLLQDKIVMPTWDDMYLYLVEYINKNNKLPTALYVLDNSIRLGSWLTTQKHKVTHKLIVPNRLSKLMEIKSFKKWYDSSLTRVIKPVISWDESFERYRQYIIKNNALCPQLFVESDGWRIGYWQDVQKRNIFKNMENERKTRLLSLEVFRKWYETNPKYIEPNN